jgi:hypothetical protein
MIGESLVNEIRKNVPKAPQDHLREPNSAPLRLDLKFLASKRFSCKKICLT